MADTLVAFALADDVLHLAEVWVPDAGPGATRRLKPEEHLSPPELLRKHPQAFFLVEVPASALWQPPEEPSEGTGPHWVRDTELRRAHCEHVRASLERFLNGVLGALERRFSTGQWVLGRVRTRVVELRGLPGRQLGPRRGTTRR